MKSINWLLLGRISILDRWAIMGGWKHFWWAWGRAWDLWLYTLLSPLDAVQLAWWIYWTIPEDYA